MAGAIQGKEVFSDSILQSINDINNGVNKILEGLKEMSSYGQKISGAKNIKELKEETDGLNKVNAKFYENSQKLKKVQQELSGVEREREKIKKQSYQTLSQLLVANENSNKVLQKGKIALQEKNKAIKEEIKLNKTVAGSLDNQRLKLKQMIAQYSSGENTSRKFRGEINKLRKEVEKKEKSLGIATRGVGRYAQGVQTAILKIGGFYMAIKGIITGIGKMIKITSEFEEQMDTTQAILGANEEEMRRLERAARDLGAGSSKTASEAGKLQEELGKLGFTVREVLLSGGGILALAEATKSDLGDAARVAASTIRGFGKDAKETNHVVDVMAKSFNSTGLNLEKFETGMANAQVAAKSTNISLEKTTAMLGTIVDTGTDASKAGTDLRVIFGKLAKQNISLDDAFAKVNKSGNKVVTAMELVGDRAYSSLITLSEQTDKVNQLSTAFENADGTALAMATTMKDNLKGDIDRAKSAWEEFVLSVDSGNGVITKSVRGTIRMFTGLSNWLARLNKDSKELALIETMDEAAEKANKFVESLADSESNEKIGQIKQRIEEINKEITNLGISDEDLSAKEFKRKMAMLENERTALRDHVSEIESIEKEALKAKLQAELLAQGEKEAKIKKSNEWEEEQMKKMLATYQEGVDKEDEIDITYITKALEDRRAFLDEKLAMFAEETKVFGDEVQKRKEAEIQAEKEALETVINAFKKRMDIVTGYSQEAGAILGKSIGQGEEAMKEAGKQILLLTLKTIKGILQQNIIAATTKAIVGSLTTEDSIMTAGVTGLIRAGVIVGLIEAAYAGVEGMLERAIPSFYKGVKDFGGGLSVVGDAPHGKSTELIKFPNNKNMLVNEPTLINLPKGTDVIPEKQIQTELANLAMRGKEVQEVRIGNEIDLKGIEKAVTNGIKKQPQHIYKGNSLLEIIEGNNRIQYINKRFRHV